MFVLDTTGSMQGAIESTHQFLTQLNKSMRSVGSSGGSEAIDLGVAGKLELSSNLNLAVSLIGFQDIPPATGPSYTTREYFSGLDIVRDFPRISAGFLQAKRDLSGGREALHHGVLRALEQKYWREAAAARLIVVITDEPGETNMQQVVYEQLPAYSEDLLRAVPSLRLLSHDKQKKDVTKIFSIYLGPEEGRRLFREKSEVYSREIFSIVGFGNEPGLQVLSNALVEVLVEQQVSVNRNLKAFAASLRRGDNFGEQGASPEPAEVVVRETIERQGHTFDEIDELSDRVFFRGFIDLGHVGGLTGSKSGDLRTKDWRARVHLERRTVGSLYDVTKKVAEALGHVLEDDELFGELGSQDDETRRQAIGMLMVLVHDVATGRGEFNAGIDGRVALGKAVRALLQTVEVDPRIKAATFARFLRIDPSLPLRTNGLMNTSLGEMLAKTRSWFVVQRDEYTLKADGLGRILRDRTVPEDFRGVWTTVHAERKWFAPSSVGALEEFGYIPLGYLP